MLLRIFFIKPVAAVITTEQLQRDNLDALVEESQCKVDAVMAERARLLNDAHIFFQTHAPSANVEQPIFRDITTSLVLHELSREELARHTDMVTHALLKRLKENNHG